VADTYTSSTYDTAPTSNYGGLFLGLGFGIFLIAFIFGFIAFNRKKNALRKQRDESVRSMKIILPKQQKEDEERRDPRELVAVMEPVYAVIQHFYESGFKRRMLYGQPTFSFEIVSHHGEIYFYVLAPEDFLDAMERQIHAQYPSAHIELAHDYDVFAEQGGESSVAALALQKNQMFPVRTYKSLDHDPLSAISNSLSKVQQGKAAIQILVRPIDQSWQHSIEQALQNVQQGKPFHAKEGAWAKVGAAAKEVGKTAVGTQESSTTQNEANNVTVGNVRLTALQEQQAKLLVEKGSKIGLSTQIRVVARASSQIDAKSQIQTMLSSFQQFHTPEANGFKPVENDNRELLLNYIQRSFSKRQPTLVLNTEELASILHFPNLNLDTPNIHWLGARKLAPPSNLPKSGVALGFSQFRGADQPVYMQYPDRMRHLYMIGKTGVGKTVMFQNMILQDIRNGHGVCYMDPNGDAIEWILKHIPKERAEDVIHFDPSDASRPMALNLMEYDGRYPEQKTMVINEIISIFDKLYDLQATGGPIFEQYMRNSMLLLMDDPNSGATLMEIPKVLADEQYRKQKLATCRNQVVVDFWVKEAEKAGGDAALQNIVPYITSKLTQFTSNDIMRPIIGQQKSAFNFREAMDQGKILLVTLPKGLLGDMNAQLLGMIISGKIQIAAFSRQNQPEAERRPFFLYVDEFQNFTSKTFATILSEARKYALSLNVTNQFIKQLDDDTREAIMGNVGTMIAWRIGAQDAEFLQKELDPVQIDDMVNTEKYNFYIRTLIDGAPTKTFNVTSYGPDPHENIQVGDAIRQLSRLKYGRDRDVVEAEIRLRGRGIEIPMQKAA
jgi:TraM recognition site of TraD and TraG